STKYLNFGEENSGIIVTPNFGSSTVRSFRLTTANDAVERDPTSYELYGTNDTIQSRDNSTGLGENWTLIDSGSLSLPNARRTNAPVVNVSNSTAYRSYKLMFPTVKNAAAANSMQVADIRFYQSSNAGGTQILSANDPALAVHLTNDATADGLSEWSQLVNAVYSVETPADASTLRITEVHYHPAEPTNAELAIAPGTADNDYEFIELVNFGTNPVSLNGVRFVDGIDFDFTTGSITSVAPGEAVVLVEDMVAFEARYGAGLPVAGTYSGNLNNGGEQVAVSAADGSEIHNFIYDDAQPWPTLPDGSGPSLQIVDPFGDYNDPANWQRSPLANGTPGVYEAPSNDGDFNDDGQLDCSDIDALSAAAASGANMAEFDLTGDGVVNIDDVMFWITDLRQTIAGDANLDGGVDVSDFNIWNSNKFQTTTDWCQGNFNADSSVDVSDFNVWNSNKFQVALLPFFDPGTDFSSRESQSEELPLELGTDNARLANTGTQPIAASYSFVSYVDNYFAQSRRKVREVQPVKVFELGDLGL
ncbi:MAG: lamin tail domain-containing protein, partial [Planctomycetota bacterium]